MLKYLGTSPCGAAVCSISVGAAVRPHVILENAALSDDEIVSAIKPALSRR